VRVDTRLDDGVTPDQVDSWVPTASILHSNGDALDTRLCTATASDHVDRAFVDAHTVGYDELVARVKDCTPEWAAISDNERLATVTSCHLEAIRTMKWTVQKLKEASPQVLAS